MEIKYNGSYRHHIGSLQYLATLTRSDLVYAVQRLATYNNNPNILAWEGIHRIYRYLAHDVIRPIFFPAYSLDLDSPIKVQITKDKEECLTIPNGPALFTDIDLAGDLATRFSYACSIITMFGVIIYIKVIKSQTVFPHTTDAEMYATYIGVHKLRVVRSLFNNMGLHTLANKPTITYGDNAATLSVIESTRITPRVHHFDIPIAYLHFYP